ncbi:MAG: hypothetical protein ACLT76_03105 [Clostridium fessum]
MGYFRRPNQRKNVETSDQRIAMPDYKDRVNTPQDPAIRTQWIFVQMFKKVWPFWKIPVQQLPVCKKTGLAETELSTAL